MTRFNLMRIRIMQKPDTAAIDGLRLDYFETGRQYDVGPLLAAYLMAEGWAEPVPDDEPALGIPLREAASGTQRERRGQASPSGRRDKLARAAELPKRR